MGLLPTSTYINVTATCSLISAIFVFGIGIFVYIKNKKAKINIVFALTCLVFAIWLFASFMMFKSRIKEQAIFWDRFVYIGVVFVPTLLYHFGLIFTRNIKKKKSLILGYVLSFIFLVLSRTDYFVADLFIHKWGWHTKAYIFHHLFLVFFTVYILLFYIQVFKFYKEARNSIERNQAKYIFIAFLILVGIGSIAYLPAYGIGVPFFSYFAPTIFALLTAYAIVAHHLMDIKFVLRNSFVYLTSLSTIIILVTGVSYIFNRFFINIATWAEVIIIILAVSSFSSIKNYYYRIANKYFFSSLYDSREVIATLSDKLRSTLEVDKICNFISQTLINSFHTKAVGILRYEEKKNQYLVQHNKGFKISPRKKFAGDMNLHNLFVKKSKSIIVEELKDERYKKSQPTLNLLRKSGVEILTPLNIKNKTIGLIVLAAKESKDMYNHEDLRVLEVIAAQTAIALQNALLYQESLAFGQKLKQEVKQATRELRQANVRLKQLDKAKTEFVSITSHQLRTPLTGIKGYLSMLLEGDYGGLKREQAEVMEDIFNNTQRLVRLINIFLNVSRIESGRLKLEKTRFNLVELIQEAMREMKTEGDKKKLKLEFTPHFLKKSGGLEILADRDKLADVILNLIDNAIKYTTKGSVIIDAEIKQNKVRVSVRDTGVGIDPSETRELFTKFTRGKKISQVSTTGSGLGLFIAKKIVELHQGRIWVESGGKGRGSTFIFEVPCE